jgi:hypothetical protein
MLPVFFFHFFLFLMSWPRSCISPAALSASGLFNLTALRASSILQYEREEGPCDSHSTASWCFLLVFPIAFFSCTLSGSALSYGNRFSSEYFCASNLQNERVYYCLFQQCVPQRQTANYEAVKLHFKAAQKLGEVFNSQKQ